MSLFDLAIGNSEVPRPLMGMAGLTPQIVARYRDHWLEREGEDTLIVAVYVRLGGGNRAEYAEQLDAMHALPTFVSDADDGFDNTYCTLRFRVPKPMAYEWLMENHRDQHDRVTIDEVWQEMWDAAEPIPRDMDVIWRAMLHSMGADADE